MAIQFEYESPKAVLGNLQAYTVNRAAIPVAVSDSAGAITSFNLTTAGDEQKNVERMWGEKVVITGTSEGAIEGEVVSVARPEGSQMVTMSADTFMSKFNTEQHCYPVYRNGGSGTYVVPAAVDQWTQQAGLFYDKVPGDVQLYHSFFSHGYIWLKDSNLAGRVTVTNEIYDLVGDRMEQRASAATGGFGFEVPNRYFPLARARVSATTSSDLVFSAGLDFLGYSSGTLIFELRSDPFDLPGLNLQVYVAYANATGYTLNVREFLDGRTPPAWTAVTSTLAPSSGPGRKRVYVSMDDRVSGIGGRFKVVDEDSGTTLFDVSWGAGSAFPRGNFGLVRASNSTTTSSGGDMHLYGLFITAASMAEASASVMPTQKVLAPSANANEFVPGLTANVWDSLKTLLALHRMDLWYEDKRLRLAPRETVVRSGLTLTDGTASPTARTGARSIEIALYNHAVSTTATKLVLFSADSVYSVATAEKQVIKVQTDHSIDTLSQPVCVAGISPYPYKSGTGQYVVTGSDGYIVSTAFWRDNGGSITVAPTEKDGEIEITIQAPTNESSRAPYRISEGAADRPALYITGTGLVANKEMLQIVTGNPKASQDIGTSFDSPLVSTGLLAYDAASQISLTYASPLVEYSVTELRGYDETSPLAGQGHVEGAIISSANGNFRVNSVTRTHNRVEVSGASAYNTIGAVNDSFAGATIATTNAYKDGMTIKDACMYPLMGQS